ncbi:MAG: hypothetical protein Q4C22_06805 [Bacillota bacterium]|nr:hypothetical protein [Bacillota bacterium]
MKNFYGGKPSCGPRPQGCKPAGNNKWGDAKVFGAVLLVIGVTTICAFVLPPKVWLVVLGGALIFLGYKLFTS